MLIKGLLGFSSILQVHSNRVGQSAFPMVKCTFSHFSALGGSQCLSMHKVFDNGSYRKAIFQLLRYASGSVVASSWESYMSRYLYMCKTCVYMAVGSNVRPVSHTAPGRHDII